MVRGWLIMAVKPDKNLKHYPSKYQVNILYQNIRSHLKNRKMVRGQASGPLGLRPGGDGAKP
jgi:hypothetical protein